MLRADKEPMAKPVSENAGRARRHPRAADSLRNASRFQTLSVLLGNRNLDL